MKIDKVKWVCPHLLPWQRAKRREKTQEEPRMLNELKRQSWESRKTKASRVCRTDSQGQAAERTPSPLENLMDWYIPHMLSLNTKSSWESDGSVYAPHAKSEEWKAYKGFDWAHRRGWEQCLQLPTTLGNIQLIGCWVENSEGACFT